MLRGLVADLQQLGLTRLLLEQPELRSKLTTFMRVLWGEEFGKACLYVFPSLPEESKTKLPLCADEAAEGRAFSSFWLLTLNTHSEKLAGPCARCGNYFIRKRSTQKVYCSRRCGNASTAVARTRARLETEHRDKMRRAEAAIRAWNALKTRGEHDWLRWLAEREPDITGKFITRHVNAGKLPIPKRGRSL